MSVNDEFPQQADYGRNELDRVLKDGEPIGAPPPIGLATFTIACAGDAASVLALARSTMAAVLRHSDKALDDLGFWRSTLPAAFVARCAPEMSPAEAEAFIRLPLEERMRERPWSLLAWLHWFQVDERQWFWWRAECRDSTTITVQVHVVGWPFPHGALDWLFLASGALGVEGDE